MAEEAYPSGIAVRLLDLIEPTEFEPRASDGLLSGQPVSHVGVDLLLQVEPQFVIELLLDDVAPEERAQPEEEVAQHRAPLHAFDDLGDDRAQLAPGRDLTVQTCASAFGQLVVLRAPVVVRRAPRGLDPSSALEPMERGIQGALANIQCGAGDLMQALRDGPSVSRLERQRLENQEIECSLRKIELVRVTCARSLCASTGD